MKPRQMNVIEPTFQVPPYRFEVLKMTYTDSEGRTIGKQMSPPIDQIEIPEGGCLLEFQTAGGKNVEQPIELVTESTLKTEDQEVEQVEQVEDNCEDCPEGDCEDCPEDNCEDCPEDDCEDCPEGDCEDCPEDTDCDTCDDTGCEDCDDAE